jgi:hypothetical protein
MAALLLYESRDTRPTCYLHTYLVRNLDSHALSCPCPVPCPLTQERYSNDTGTVCIIHCIYDTRYGYGAQLSLGHNKPVLVYISYSNEYRFWMSSFGYVCIILYKYCTYETTLIAVVISVKLSETVTTTSTVT